MGSTPQPQQFCLKWNNHQANMLAVFERLLGNKSLVDVTLGCEGRQIKAHKVVLSACSPFFEGLFTENPCKHPIVILKDIRYADLKALVEFMYKGEVNVVQEQLPTLLKTAEALKIKGLAEVTGETRDDSSSNQQQNRSASNSTPRPESPNSARRKRQRARRRSTDSAGGGDVVSDSEESVPKASRTDLHDESSMDGASSHDDGSQASLQRGSKKETASVQTNVDSTSSPASVSASAKSSRSADQTATAASKSSAAANSNGQVPSSKDTGGGDFEPSRLLEASMTTEQGGDDSTDNLNNTTGPDNSTNNELDIKPLITLDEGGATPTGAIVPASAAAAAALAGADALSSLFPQGAGAAAALAGTSFQNSPPSHGTYCAATPACVVSRPTRIEPRRWAMYVESRRVG